MTTQELDATPVEIRPAERDATIDVLKGIGIVVVAMGHIDFTPIGGSLDIYLYTFNVPLFFIVAGYMWRPKPGVSIWRAVQRRFRQIYVPYVVLFVVSLLYGNLVYRHLFHQEVIPFDFQATVKAFVFASDWLNTVPTFNFALWFLPIFLITSVAFQFLQKIGNVWVYLVVLAFLFVASYPVELLLPGRPVLNINVLPVGLVLMGCGHLLRRFVPLDRVPVVIYPILLVFTLAVTMWAPGNISGMGSYLFVPSALASFVIYLGIAQQLRSSSWLAYVGINSLIVFGIHGLVANTYQFTHIPGFLDRHWNGALVYVINLGYVLVGSVLVVAGFRAARRGVGSLMLSLPHRQAAGPEAHDEPSIVDGRGTGVA